jgi:hypothetical protein
MPAPLPAFQKRNFFFAIFLLLMALKFWGYAPFFTGAAARIPPCRTRSGFLLRLSNPFLDLQVANR